MAISRPLVLVAGELAEIPSGNTLPPEILLPTAVACRIYNNANISITNGSGGLQTITFNSERQDDFGMHSTSSNTNRITAVKAGWYQAIANLRWAANGTGYRQHFFQKNSSLSLAFGGDIRMPVTVGGVQTDVNITGVVYLAVNDWVDVVVGQNSGGALNIEYTSGNQISPDFSLFWLGT